MPTLDTNRLVQNLTQRVNTSLNQADVNADGAVDAAERATLPDDVRGLADNTADAYVGGGPLPIDAYTNAYRDYASAAILGADSNRDGQLSDSEQANLPSSVYSSVIALRTNVTDTSSTQIDSLFQQLSQGGFSEDEVRQFTDAVVSSGQVQRHADKLWAAILNPTVPPNAHAGAAFLEALAWYTDKTIVRSGDGQLTRGEIENALAQKAQEYFSLYGDANAGDARIQTWKYVQKLRILEQDLDATGQDSYAYDASRLSRINSQNPWNAAHTIDSAAEFQQKVIDASYDKPVLVKYGLTYCVHCLLLEHLDSVKAVADKYGSSIDVQKVWWNPNDPAMAEISDLTVGQGVTSSPYFIVYKDGQKAREGYAFPDENGNGVQELLNGLV